MLFTKATFCVPLLYCVLSLATQCTVIGPVCGFVCSFVRLCMCVFVVGLLPR